MVKLSQMWSNFDQSKELLQSRVFYRNFSIISLIFTIFKSGKWIFFLVDFRKFTPQESGFKVLEKNLNSIISKELSFGKDFQLYNI